MKPRSPFTLSLAKRPQLGIAVLFLFCALAASSLHAAVNQYFDNATLDAAWSTSTGNHFSPNSTGGSDGNWTNGNYAYFFATDITPANPMAVTVGSGITTARITDVNSPGNLTFNSATITLIGGANLTGYCLVRNETGNQMIFNSVIAGTSVGLYTGFSGGTIVLGGANTYTGGTIAGAGTLVIQNGTSATGTGNVLVENDPNNSTTLVGTLSWNTTTAKIPGSVTVSSSQSGLVAKLGPSTGISALNIGGSLTFGANSQPIFALSSAYNGANDKVAVTSTLTCGSVQVGISCGSTLDTSGNDYVLFTSSGVSGSFNSTPIWTATTPQYAGQYTIITSGSQVHLHFTPIALSVTAAANTKTYDGTTSAAATPSYTGTLASGDSFSPTETYNAKDVGSTTLTPAGTVSGGHGYYTYTYNPASSGVINAKALTMSGLSVPSSKVYDGGTTAAVSGSPGSLQSAESAGSGSTGDGKPYSGDTVSITGTATGTYNSKDVSTASSVTFGGLSPGGAQAGDYSLTIQSPASATITALPVSLSGTRVYDGTTNAAATILSVANKIGADTVNVASGTGGLAGKNVGTQSLTSFGSLALGNNSAGDYTLSGASGSVTITKASTAIAVNSSEAPSGFKDSISFTATNLASDATGNVIFTTNGTAFSTNAVSGGAATSAATTLLPRGTNSVSVGYAGDANYSGSTNSLSQIVTNHPPVAAIMTVSRTAGLALMIALSDVATNWSDVDGDTVALTGVNLLTTNNVTLTTNATWIFYTNSPNVNDQFSYGINDGHGGTNLGLVNIVIVSNVTGTSSISSIVSGNPTTVTAFGVPGYSYVTQRATNMSSPVWVNISTNTAATNGVLNVTDNFNDLGSQPSSAYYRISWSP